MAIRHLHNVLFLDGTSGRFAIYIYQGGCMAGDPTSYVFRNGQLTWVIPGESVEFIEASK